MNKQELDLIGRLQDSEVQKEIENLRKVALEQPQSEEEIFEDTRSLDDVIREVAEGEGLTFEETKKLFMKGIRTMKNISNSANKPTVKQKEKAKKKKRMAKASKKRNR